MNTHASPAANPHRSAMAGLGSGDTFCPVIAVASGLVTPTGTTGKNVGILHLQLRRGLLIERLEKLQRQSRNREASICRLELCAVTKQIMGMEQA